MTTGITQGRFVVPSVVTTNFHLREGDIVADYGAGSGYFVEALSQAVGETGRVYACEIQRELVEKIGNLVRTKGIGNTDPVWCDIEVARGIKIADDTLDAAVLINTFFQVEDKATTLHEICRTLRSGGKFIVVDWSESFNGLGPQPDQIVSSNDAKALIESNGFSFDREFDAGDHHYGLAFKKI